MTATTPLDTFLDVYLTQTNELLVALNTQQHSLGTNFGKFVPTIFGYLLCTHETQDENDEWLQFYLHVKQVLFDQGIIPDLQRNVMEYLLFAPGTILVREYFASSIPIPAGTCTRQAAKWISNPQVEIAEACQFFLVDGYFFLQGSIHSYFLKLLPSKQMLIENSCPDKCQPYYVHQPMHQPMHQAMDELMHPFSSKADRLISNQVSQEIQAQTPDRLCYWPSVESIDELHAKFDYRTDTYHTYDDTDPLPLEKLKRFKDDTIYIDTELQVSPQDVYKRVPFY